MLDESIGRKINNSIFPGAYCNGRKDELEDDDRLVFILLFYLRDQMHPQSVGGISRHIQGTARGM